VNLALVVGSVGSNFKRYLKEGLLYLVDKVTGIQDVFFCYYLNKTYTEMFTNLIAGFS
jgi:hypothetical protein